METVSNRLKMALEIRQMRQADLANITGIGKSSISTYLAGSYLPKQKNIYRMAKALHVSESWLMGYDVPMESTGEPYNQQIAKHIKSARNEVGLTQKEAAIKAGMSVKEYQKYESGEMCFYSGLQRIANAFGVHILEITGIKDEMDKYRPVYELKPMKGKTPSKEDFDELSRLLYGDVRTMFDALHAKEQDLFFRSIHENEIRERLEAAMNKLNIDGQLAAVTYIEDLTQIPKYQRPQE